MSKLILYGEELSGRLSNALRKSNFKVNTDSDVTDELIDEVARFRVPALGRKSRDEFFSVLIRVGRVPSDYLDRKYNTLRWPITEPTGWLRGVLYQETDSTFEGACRHLERSRTEKINRLGERGKAELERLINEVRDTRNHETLPDHTSCSS